MPRLTNAARDEISARTDVSIMLNTAMLPYESGECPGHRKVARASVEERLLVANSMLARYLKGWAEADPAKIAAATADDYDFYDPLVGRYSRRTLPQYFALLRSRFAVAGVPRVHDLAFTLCGPMLGPSRAARRQYWREAPHLGLTGVSEIMVTHRGVAAEAVAYDLNMACETLLGRRCSEDCRLTERPGRI
jgi:hypothetical protein